MSPHAASAYLAAAYPTSSVPVLDGCGERASHLAGRAVGGELEIFATQALPHSLGLLYEEVTAHLGFRRSSDEWPPTASPAGPASSASSRLYEEGPFDRIWAQPAAGDAGTALGGALPPRPECAIPTSAAASGSAPCSGAPGCAGVLDALRGATWVAAHRHPVPPHVEASLFMLDPSQRASPAHRYVS